MRHRSIFKCTLGAALAALLLTIAWSTMAARSSALNTRRTAPATGPSASRSARHPARGVQPQSAATVKTDAADYPPGATVTVTGSGWSPGETVTLTFVENPQNDGPHVLTTSADPSGNINDANFVVSPQDNGITFTLTATGGTSGQSATTTFTDTQCNSGTGVVTVTGNNGSCVGQTPPQGNGPFDWEVVEGGSYTMTITGVTECTDPAITVFIQSTSTGNFCFNATLTSPGTYSGSFTMPNPACFTYPISYKCGASALCNNPGSFNARGPGGACTVHLRASTFDSGCIKTGNDENCTGTPQGCTITCPVDKTVECGSSTDPSVTGMPVVTGGCTATHSDSFVSACGNTGTITRTWSVTDAQGVTSSCTQTITIVDTTKPTISCPGDKTVECGSDTSPDSTGTATGSDTCGNVQITHIDSFAPACGRTGVITRTWTATDACGNTNTCTQKITIVDTTKPTISCPTDMTVECGADTSPASTGTATGSDTCGNVQITHSDSFAPACGRTGVITRTWTATDACGNTNTCTQKITIVDTTKPTVSCPSSFSIQLRPGDTCPPSVPFTVTASDACSTPTITCIASGATTGPVTSGSTFNVGVTTVTCTATDACGNVSVPCSFNITVYTSICVTKFYDANTNGTQDNGEVGIAGWKILLTGASSPPPAFTGADGSYCFLGLLPGDYTVTEVLPRSSWINTTPLSRTLRNLTCPVSVSFGNVCLGPGGGLTLGFWSNKNGQAILAAHDPAWRTLLNGLNLRNADGSSFTVSTVDTFSKAYSAFRTWLLGANATNMAYMLSAQLAAMELNVNFGNVKGSSLVFAGTTCSEPGLSAGGFITVNDLMADAVAELAADGLTLSGNPDRTCQEFKKTALDNANNNLNFVQSSPCPFTTPY